MKKLDINNEKGQPTEDFSIPSAGIEDLDRVVFALFDSEINFEVESNSNLVKVPVVFAAGERFALTRRKNPIRDNNDALILPLISITRGSTDFSPNLSNRGSAINVRKMPNYTIKKKLSKKDRNYQNIINYNNIANQDNISTRSNLTRADISPGNVAKENNIASRRQGNPISFSKSGGLINLGKPDNQKNNIFEIIQIPYPIQFAIEYDVVFWSQYMVQMNQLKETFLSRIPGTASEFKIINEKGYEYVIKLTESFTDNNNFDDYTSDERVLKTSFKLTAVGYIINPTHSGIPNGLKSYFSAPFIEFGYYSSNSQVILREQNNLQTTDNILTDIQTMEEITRENIRGQSNEEVLKVQFNPFSNSESKSYGKISTRNQRAGETVASLIEVKKIDTQHE